MTFRRWTCAFLTAFLTAVAAAQTPAHDAAPPGPQRVEFSSLDAPGGQAVPCQALAGAQGGHAVRVESFEGAHHGFDGRAALTLRREVPSGVNPGQGVHVGAQPEARERSRQILIQALQQAFAR